VITEKGTLPIGIERDGKYHREFEIRPALVRDTVEVAGEQEPRKIENASFYGLALTAKQIVRIGEISPVSADMLMEMLDEDFGEIARAKGRLAARLKSFHGESADPGEQRPADAAAGGSPDEKADPGPPQDAAADGPGA